MRQPCESCPWRVGVDAWAIGRDHSLEVPPLHRREMESVARRQEHGFAAPIMACHLTHRGEESIQPQDRICVGFALQVGAENLRFRVLAIDGTIDPSAYECGDPLHPDFTAMLAANPGRPGCE